MHDDSKVLARLTVCVAPLLLVSCGQPHEPTTAEVAPVLATYADILHASYEDSLVRGSRADRRTSRARSVATTAGRSTIRTTTSMDA
jgi:uncharacterized iron-regulated protein